MIRLRGFAASAGQVRLRGYGASAGQVRLRGYGAAARLALTTAAIVLMAGHATLFACPQCFGAEETTTIDGTKLGILALLGITLAVQGAFAGFFFYLRRRAKRIAEMDLDTEWSELQGASRT